MSPPRPTHLGPYEIIGKLGGGGMAAVFLGRRSTDSGKDELAAVKVIRADLAKEAHFVEMFYDEAKLLSRLVHPNISKTLEVGHTDHVGYIAMELLLGRTLADTWEAAKAADVPLRFDLSAWICAEVARGLHYAHHHTDEKGHPLGLIHRDVNPSNIFLSYDGTIKLFDFGLAMAHGRKSQTKTGIVKGKVAYLSPEQVTQIPLDQRSDIFSLGITLWEMTTLTRLFKRGNDLDSVVAIRDGVVPDARAIVDDYPEPLYAIAGRALATNRDDRYLSAAALADDLQAYVESCGLTTMGDFVGAVLDRFFPGERQKQMGWLEKTVTLPFQVGAPTMMPPAPIVTESGTRVEPSVPMQLVHKKS